MNWNIKGEAIYPKTNHKGEAINKLWASLKNGIA